MYDLRKARRYDARNVHPLIIDTNRFNRNLMGEIMRTINIVNVENAKTESDAIRLLHEKRCSVIFIEWSDLNEMDVLPVIRRIRQMNDDFVRRVPIIATSSQLTKEHLVEGRNYGVDEFLKKPCSPADVENRLRMVIETPRPFVDSKVYVGPCRRRKNPADYHGPRRRERDDVGTVKTLTDAERQLIDKSSPIALSLARLKMCCSLMQSGQQGAYDRVSQAILKARQAAIQHKDKSFMRALKAFEAYVDSAAMSNSIDREILLTGISTLEQLVVLPIKFEGARETVAHAYQDAIQRKLAA